MTEITSRDVMRPASPTLAPDTPIRRAVAELLDLQATAAPVIGADGALAGILTRKDCFRPALQASYYREWTGTVADHMSLDVVTVDIDANLISLAETFLSSPHRVFPVLEGAQVAGMLYRADVLDKLVRLG